MRPALELEATGIPQPQGSKTAGRTTSGQTFLRETNQALPPWRATLAAVARQAMREREPLTGPLQLEATFRFPRPKHHFRTGQHAGQLKTSAPRLHSTRPDLDKLLRALDALTGIAWHDDAQIAQIEALKLYGTPGLHLVVYTLEGPS